MFWLRTQTSLKQVTCYVIEGFLRGRNSFTHLFHVQKSKLGNPAFGYGTSQNITAKHNTSNTNHKNTIHAIQVTKIQYTTVTHTKHNSQENN